MMPPPLVSRFMGTWSAMGSRHMMVAHACTPSPRTCPSRDFAASMTCFTSSSDSYAFLRSGLVASALSMVMPSSSPIILQMRSPVLYG